MLFDSVFGLVKPMGESILDLIIKPKEKQKETAKPKLQFNFNSLILRKVEEIDVKYTKIVTLLQEQKELREKERKLLDYLLKEFGVE